MIEDELRWRGEGRTRREKIVGRANSQQWEESCSQLVKLLDNRLNIPETRSRIQ